MLCHLSEGHARLPSTNHKVSTVLMCGHSRAAYSNTTRTTRVRGKYAASHRGEGPALRASGDGAALRPVRAEEEEPKGISAKSSCARCASSSAPRSKLTSISAASEPIGDGAQELVPPLPSPEVRTCGGRARPPGVVSTPPARCRGVGVPLPGSASAARACAVGHGWRGGGVAGRAMPMSRRCRRDTGVRATMAVRGGHDTHGVQACSGAALHARLAELLRT